ncbi:MAG: translation elongation factor Ts [Peptococcaceae bacterium]|jgi:elongation factor Ts|nr:translation elongation factor Ts [Peptococcaceae bacterium]MDH7524068.1 translation elongation factor Ts [Peptococcaceae bacterium]
MEITAQMVKELRERTGAGMMDCKKALVEKSGDLDKAIEYLREKGLAAAAKRAGRIAAEGIIESYIHGGGRIGVLLEVNCETDFVAKTPEFRELAKEIAMQVAASRPEYVEKADVPEEVINKEREIFRQQALNEGKPEKVVDKMVEGRVEKFYKEVCLMEQQYIRNPEITVRQLIVDKIAKIGENIRVRRFARYELGEGLEKKKDTFVDDVMAQIKG